MHTASEERRAACDSQIDREGGRQKRSGGNGKPPNCVGEAFAHSNHHNNADPDKQQPTSRPPGQPNADGEDATTTNSPAVNPPDTPTPKATLQELLEQVIDDDEVQTKAHNQASGERIDTSANRAHREGPPPTFGISDEQQSEDMGPR